MLFEPDVFSEPLPGWSVATDPAIRNIGMILPLLPPAVQNIQKDPEQSGAFNLSSSNYRLHTDTGIFFLKRWGANASLPELHTSLDIMHWLAGQGLPVHPALPLGDGSMILNHKNGAWSVFPYDDGHYFSGAEGELDDFAAVSGRLFQTLSTLPESMHPVQGPVVLEKSEHDLFMLVENSKPDWVSFFGEEETKHLSRWWPRVIEERSRLNSMGGDFGPSQTVHFDLHPHNLLAADGCITAILDFESCKRMAVGPALGFAALKQCRQAVSISGTVDEAAEIGKRFARLLTDSYPASKAMVSRLGDFAVSEVLRRIGLILKINMEDNNRDWNHVLPVQLNHLGEARALFG